MQLALDDGVMLVIAGRDVPRACENLWRLAPDPDAVALAAVVTAESQHPSLHVPLKLTSPQTALIGKALAMSEPSLPDEQLSPESVLVLPPVLRAQAIARLAPPNRPTSRPHVRERVAEHAPERVVERVLEYVAESPPEHAVEHVPESPPLEAHALPGELSLRSLGVLVAGRVVQLGLVFLAVTLVTLAMSVVAHAFR